MSTGHGRGEPADPSAHAGGALRRPQWSARSWMQHQPQWWAHSARTAAALGMAAVLVLSGCTPGSQEGQPDESTQSHSSPQSDGSPQTESSQGSAGSSGEGGTTGGGRATDQEGTAGAGEDADAHGSNEQSTQAFSAAGFIRGLNLSLQEQDRGRFLGAVGADAQDAVGLWWDNMDVLGMRSGGISIESGKLKGLQAGQSREVTVRLGALTAGTPQAHADTDSLTSGEYLVGASTYKVTVSVDSAGKGRITSFKPAGPPTPWDEGPLTAVTTDHVLVAGLQSEEEVVQRVADMVAEPAQWVLDQYREGLGREPIQRFTLFATGEQDRVSTWFQTDEVNSELAGFTVPQPRLARAPGLDERIATADSVPWGASVVTVGPQGVESREALQSLTAHEFTHAVNFARLPIAEDRSRVISEGWAEYQQELWDSGSFAPSGSWRDKQLRSCLEAGRGFPTDADFDVEGTQIYCGYVLSASVYAYAAAQGVDVYALSSRARSTGQDLIETSEHLDSEPLTKAGWKDWVQAHFA